MNTNQALTDAAAAAVGLLDSLNGGLTTPSGGSLTVVGTGIRAITQLTLEALAVMTTAEVLLHVIGEPIQEEALLAVNPRASTLTGLYADGMDRSATYEAMVQQVLASVMAGKRTVAAFYGHPGVFTYPSHESVRRVRAAGYPARMLPAVSAADCLYADLGVDPGDGSQAYEATDFLWMRQRPDPGSHLLLWQAGSIGNWTYESAGYDMSAFPALVAKLLAIYPRHHPVTVYEAAFHPSGRARVLQMPLHRLHASHVTPASTLFVPALPRTSSPARLPRRVLHARA
jgi:uncharacterized protein YabN with tetrapyrrole methylase and pyrophosphatase domain